MALIGSTVAVAGMLYVLALAHALVSGCHLNPAVTLPALIRGELGWRDAGLKVLSQGAAAVCGVTLAHMMFEAPVVQIAATAPARSGLGKLLAEALATFVLVFTIDSVSHT